MITYNLTCLLSISAHEQSLKTVVLGMQLDCSFSAVHYMSLNVETKQTDKQRNVEFSTKLLDDWGCGGALVAVFNSPMLSAYSVQSQCTSM